MQQYGIIGKPLGHSYSEDFFTQKFIREGIEASYRALEIDTIEEVRDWLKLLDGFNVTYPYKEQILPYLREIDPIATQIAAVNVVHQGKGYNTDWIGFQQSLKGALRPHHQRALLFGTGGVSKAIQFALREMGISYTLVSRTPRTGILGYEQINQQVLATHQLLINCTPLGMHPYEDQLLAIPYEHLGANHLLYDCIYNPAKTLFLQRGEQQGCSIINGLQMLHRQAEEAWRIWSADLNV